MQNLLPRTGLLQNMSKNGTVRPTELQNTNLLIKIQLECHLRQLEYSKIISSPNGKILNKKSDTKYIDSTNFVYLSQCLLILKERTGRMVLRFMRGTFKNHGFPSYILHTKTSGK